MRTIQILDASNSALCVKLDFPVGTSTKDILNSLSAYTMDRAVTVTDSLGAITSLPASNPVQPDPVSRLATRIAGVEVKVGIIPISL